MSFQEYPNFISILAGNGTYGFNDGSGKLANFRSPARLILDTKNLTLFVSDAGNNCIRIINTQNGTVSTFAGICGTSGGLVNGPLIQAKFNNPLGIAMLSDEMIVADRLNYVLRKIFMKNGTVTTFSGSGTKGYLDGAASVARFWLPCGIDFDRRDGFQGSILVSEGDYSLVRLVFPNGTVSTLAGTGVAGFKNGPALEAQFNWIADVRSNPLGTIYIADNENAMLRELKNGTVTTKAGKNKGYLDGPLSTALLGSVHGFAFDKNDGYIIADASNSRIRQVLNGSIITLAGTSSNTRQEGPALQSALNFPVDVFLDLDSGVLYVADYFNNCVKVICSAPCYNGGVFDCIKKTCTCVGNFYGPFCLNETTKQTQSSTLSSTKSQSLSSSTLSPTKSQSLSSSSLTSIKSQSLSSFSILGYTETTNVDNPVSLEIIIIATSAVALTIISIITFCFFRRMKVRKPSMEIVPSLQGHQIVTTPSAKNVNSLQTSTTIDSKSFSTTITSTIQGVISIPGHCQLNIDNDLILSNETKLGEGGTSVIYKCTFAKGSLLAKFGFNELVLKILKATTVDTISLLKFEIAIMSGIPPHPNIVHFVGYSQEPYAIVMKYYPMSLNQIIYNSNLQSQIDIINKVALDVAQGMEHIHKNDILHLDLKPHNVLLDVKANGTFNCVICDFGFANFVKESNKQFVTGIPMKNTLGLTPRYAAPEMIEYFFSQSSEKNRLDLEIHKKIDVYAYSICLFELINAETAWNKVSFEDIKTSVLFGKRPKASKATDNHLLQNIMAECWHQTPKDRPDFHEIVNQIKKATSPEDTLLLESYSFSNT